MSRLDEQPDFVQMVTDLERQEREIKEAQVVGSDAVKTFCLTTPNQWDFSTYVNNGSVVEKTLRFTPDDASSEKMTAGAYKLSVVATQSEVKWRRKRVTDFRYQDWTITILGYGNTAQLKCYIYTTGKGTVTFF